MSIDELYHEELLDHARKPHNQGEISGCTCTGTGKNPLCGDLVTLFIDKNGETLSRITFQGKGCVISQASASILTDALTGKSVTDAKQVIQKTVDALKSGKFDAADESVLALSGVRAFPTRLKCALLAWKLASDLIEEAS